MATHKSFSSACRAFVTISRPIWPRFWSRSMRFACPSRLVIQFDRQRLFTTILNSTRLANGEGSTMGTLIFDNELVSLRNQ
uniref:Uncharacterized protein n=1 Tax=Populus trichocarpa TaxID=3694 RepID=A0A2K1YCF9_POPTR